MEQYISNEQAQNGSVHNGILGVPENTYDIKVDKQFSTINEINREIEQKRKGLELLSQKLMSPTVSSKEDLISLMAAAKEQIAELEIARDTVHLKETIH